MSTVSECSDNSLEKDLDMDIALALNQDMDGDAAADDHNADEEEAAIKRESFDHNADKKCQSAVTLARSSPSVSPVSDCVDGQGSSSSTYFSTSSDTAVESHDLHQQITAQLQVMIIRCLTSISHVSLFFHGFQ